jgi:uncharacterized protein (DUF3820 family)
MSNFEKHRRTGIPSGHFNGRRKSDLPATFLRFVATVHKNVNETKIKNTNLMERKISENVY